jgi:hypothetical protein
VAIRLCLVPEIGTGASNDHRRPKYFGTGETTFSPPVGYSSSRYGSEPIRLVVADLSAAQITTLQGFSDVTLIPANLDATLTAGQVTTTQTALEAANIPAGWVTTALTWRQVLRTVLGMFTLLQRFKGIHGPVRLFGGAITMNSQINDISQPARGNFTTAATSLGYSTAGITGTTTIRSALKTLADQMTARSYLFGGFSI